MQACSKCSKELPESGFYKGHKECKACWAAYCSKRWYADHERNLRLNRERWKRYAAKKNAGKDPNFRGCNGCLRTLPQEAFYRRADIKPGRRGTCKECARAKVKAYREANPEKARLAKKRAVAKNRQHYRDQRMRGYYRRKAEGHKMYSDKAWARDILKQYDLTPEQYREMFDQQNGRSKICNKPQKYRLCVDHDHETGKVRGLLCKKCNSGLGNFLDDRYLLSQAIEYLSR